MTKKRILGFVLAGAMLIGVLAACATAQPPAAPVTPAAPSAPGAPAPTPGAPPPPPPEEGLGRGVRVALAIEPPNIVPARHTQLVAGFMNALTHNGLFEASHVDLSPMPDLITGWRAISDTLFEFDLVQGVRFHNGDELTSYDIMATMEYIRNFPEARAQHLSVVDWEVVDRYTFRLDTGEPNAQLFFDLAHHANNIFPGALIEAGHDFTVDPVGTGPFVFDEWRSGDFLHFNAFPDYFNTERAPRIEHVHWRIIPEGSSRTIALETGEIDYIVEVPFPDIARLEASPDVTVFMTPGTMMQMFALNNAREPFNNVYVRRAIDMALDRDAMLMASLDGFGFATYATMQPIFAGASNEGTRSFDPEGARQLLAEQGFAPGDIEFEVLFFAEDQRRRGEVVQSNLADIGITISLTMMEQAAWLPHTTQDIFDATFQNQTQPNLMAHMRAVMHSDSIDGPNRSRMSNPELDALIDQAFATIDEAERLAVLLEASRVANEHVGFIGTNSSMTIRAFNSNLVAPEIGPGGAMFFNMVYWLD